MKNINRFHAVKILEWCKQKYGRGSKPYPHIEFRKPDYLNGESADGEYDYEDNFMYINSQIHKNLESLACTIIHEYIHYRYHNKRSYNKLSDVFKYNNHPMEQEADKISNRDKKKCVVELKKYYSQFNY
jgi:Zn-dependent peptidase ImmA (M78 family)